MDAHHRPPEGGAEALERARQIRRVLWIEAGANATAAAAKLAVGIATGATVLVADAIHSTADLANNALALVAARLSHAAPDRSHPYGHSKFETLAVFALATSLAVLAVEIALRGLRAEAPQIRQPGWALGVMLAVLTLSAVVGLWESARARALQSDLLQADARHTVSDVLTTLVVIAGWQLAAAGLAWLDAVFTLLVSGLILFLAFGLFQRAIPVLVDRAVADPAALESAVQTVPGVRATHRVRSRAGGTGPRIDVVVGVDPASTTRESHAIADAIERVLQEQFGAGDITVHIEPVGEAEGPTRPGRS